MVGQNGERPLGKSISDLIAEVEAQDDERLTTAMAREFNNHVYLRGTFLGLSREMTGQDVMMVLARWKLMLQTIQLSAPGPEQYRPNSQQQRERLGLEAVERAVSGNQR